MKIAVIYIALGRYGIFWKGFYRSARKYLLKDDEKHFFVFTDNEDIYGEGNPDISKNYWPKKGWPYDTIERFDMYLSLKERLADFDYIFFFNSNAIFIRPVGREILPGSEHDGLVGAKWSRPKESFTYDRNPLSTAYIPEGEGTYYFRGGMNGGTVKAFLEMADELKQNIQKDWENGVVALWHDESHLNKYFLNRHPLVLSDDYCMDEVRATWLTPGKILIRDKNSYKYGGASYLRGESDKKIGLGESFIKSCAKVICPLCPLKSIRKKLRAFYRNC